MTVPTVERGDFESGRCSMAMAGREALDALDVGLGELLEELPRVGAERLDVAALALGVDRVERERRLARAARPGEDDELAARQTETLTFFRLCCRAPTTTRRSTNR